MRKSSKLANGGRGRLPAELPKQQISENSKLSDSSKLANQQEKADDANQGKQQIKRFQQISKLRTMTFIFAPGKSSNGKLKRKPFISKATKLAN